VVAAERTYTVEALTEALNTRISNGDFDVGSWIRQARIAQEYGVSRTPVTLALSKLEAVGVVERVANRGFRVRTPSIHDILEVLEVRALLEGHAAELAAARISGEQLKHLFDAVEAFRGVVNDARSGDVPPDELRGRWHGANALFHKTVFDAAGNRQLVESAEYMHRRVPRNISWVAMGADPRILAQNSHVHEAIAIAIDLRDGNRARELSIEHMDMARDILLTRFRESDPTP
jgi:DNA-binding GntR family transcriptional regulator